MDKAESKSKGAGWKAANVFADWEIFFPLVNPMKIKTRI